MAKFGTLVDVPPTNVKVDLPGSMRLGSWFRRFPAHRLESAGLPTVAVCQLLAQGAASP